MHSPSMGIVEFNKIAYDGFTYEEVEKEVFDKIRKRSYNGYYSVIVTLEFLDSYGNYYEGTPVTVSSLNGADVKRYASYRYFRGSSHISDAFPWNHQSHSLNGFKHDGNSSHGNSSTTPATSPEENIRYIEFGSDEYKRVMDSLDRAVPQPSNRFMDW